MFTLLTKDEVNKICNRGIANIKEIYNLYYTEYYFIVDTYANPSDKLIAESVDIWIAMESSWIDGNNYKDRDGNTISDHWVHIKNIADGTYTPSTINAPFDRKEAYILVTTPEHKLVAPKITMEIFNEIMGLS